jgi:uncharacterized protein YndB with AHSA1/START domain
VYLAQILPFPTEATEHPALVPQESTARPRLQTRIHATSGLKRSAVSGANPTRNEILIERPIETVWQRLIAAQSWPGWYSNARDVVVADPSGQLGQDGSFTWETFGLHITSKVAEFVPETRLGWYGNGNDLRAYHTWLLTPRGPNETQIVTEEVALGRGAQMLAQTNPGHMHRGHDLWNISLKFLCESPPQ